jgi:hypothetical protein
MRYVKMFPLAIGLSAITLVTFAATAHAQTAATPDSGSVLDLLKPVYNAFAGGQYAYMGTLLVILLVALTKRYLGDKLPWLHSDVGGTSTALLAAAATAAAAGLATPGSHLTFALLKTSLMVGVGAAGGFAVLKALIIEPLLIPLEAKAPAWMKPLFALVLWIFDKPDAIKQAEAAGTAAVAAKPATGLDGAAGAPPADVK